MTKTLVGKENYLFLINDTSNELNTHCDNLCICNISTLENKYTFKNYFITVFPDKCIYYKDKLPDLYNPKFRPNLEVYKNFFNDKLLDTYDFLKNEEDCYYKTDTHINLKGNYLVYCEFIKKINNMYNLNLKIKIINIEKNENIILKNLPHGIGDLTWDINAKDLNLPIIYDNYYYSKDLIEFYNRYNININDNYKFYDYNLNDVTNTLENKLFNWYIISDYIIQYKEKDLDKNEPVFLIFHDSFLLSAYQLYFYSFKNVYFVKSIFDNKIINLIKPDYVFEFRVERFLF